MCEVGETELSLDSRHSLHRVIETVVPELLTFDFFELVPHLIKLMIG